MDDALARIKNAVLKGEFRHLVVTSRESPSKDDRIWQSMTRIEPRPLDQAHLLPFIQVYLPKATPLDAKDVHTKLVPLLDDVRMPSPLFLRFAIEQMPLEGSLTTLDGLLLTLRYIETLRKERLGVNPTDMRRAAAIAAIQSIRQRLKPQEFSEEALRTALETEGDNEKFRDENGKEELTPVSLGRMLVECGLLDRTAPSDWGLYRLQFAYDPVAEYLAAWYVNEYPSNVGDLKDRMRSAPKTAVGRVYHDIASAAPAGPSAN